MKNGILIGTILGTVVTTAIFASQTKKSKELLNKVKDIVEDAVK